MGKRPVKRSTKKEHDPKIVEDILEEEESKDTKPKRKNNAKAGGL